MRGVAAVCLAAVAVAACVDGATDGDEPATTAERPLSRARPAAPERPARPEPGPSTGPLAADVVLPPAPQAGCELTAADPRNGRFAGTARVQLRGGVAVDLAAAPATCSRAGDGALFETCVPEGRVQIRSDERSDGPQKLRGLGERGASVLLARVTGGSLVMSPQTEGSTIVLARDGRSARAHVTLRAILSGETAEADLEFDCGGL